MRPQAAAGRLPPPPLPSDAYHHKPNSGSNYQSDTDSKSSPNSDEKGSSSRKSKASASQRHFDLSRLKSGQLQPSSTSPSESIDLSLPLPSDENKKANWKPIHKMWLVAAGLLLVVAVIGTILIVNKKASGAALATSSVSTFGLTLFVPAYFYPGAAWDQIITGQPSSVGHLVMNPSTGPGNKQDSMYGTYVARAQNSGIKVLGYIPTNYGKRDATQIKQDTMTYLNWYHVDGILLDEVSTDARNLSYILDISTFIRTQNQGTALIVLNTGIYPSDESYMATADMILAFEDTLTRYQSLVVPSWVSRYNASRFITFRTRYSRGCTRIRYGAGFSKKYQSCLFYGFCYAKSIQQTSLILQE
ncbi:Spherulation-specific family 4-domain-containing protein [Obelidium mucronatum]|nr:Spherulation-specific family 4-domain-containing protein [Obelidium mucronatum]